MLLVDCELSLVVIGCEDCTGFKLFTILRSLGRQSERLANDYISYASNVRRIRQQLWFNHHCKDLGLVPAGLRLKSPLNTQEAIQIVKATCRRLIRARINDCHRRLNNYSNKLKQRLDNLKQTVPTNLQLPAPYKRLVDDINNRQTTDWPTTTHGSKRTNHCLQQTNNRPTNFTNNTRTDIRLTKDGSKRTNHCVQSSQPMTTRLNWQSTNNITTSLTNHINDQSIYTTHWRYTNHLTLKMTSAQVVETSVNVTLNSPSQDYTHPDDRAPLSYDISDRCSIQNSRSFVRQKILM